MNEINDLQSDQTTIEPLIRKSQYPPRQKPKSYKTSQKGLTMATKALQTLAPVSERTARRYRAGNTIPKPTKELIDLKSAGYVLPPSWQREGVRFHRGALCLSNGDYFNLAHLEAYRTTMAGQRALIVENRILRNRIKKLEKHLPARKRRR